MRSSGNSVRQSYLSNLKVVSVSSVTVRKAKEGKAISLRRVAVSPGHHRAKVSEASPGMYPRPNAASVKGNAARGRPAARPRRGQVPRR